MIIPFGQWLPDLPPFKNPGVTIATNVFPAANSYKPWPSNTVFSSALTARARGGIYNKDKDGNVRTYVGDETKLYEITNVTWTNRSQGGGADAYALSIDSNWEFCLFGELVIACCGINADTAIPGTNDLQVITMGGANFADLGGTPPQSRHIGTVRDFVVCGNTWDGVDGLVPQRIRWSGKADEATWTVSSATQSDFEDGLNGGWCQRVIGGEYGVIFMERSIYRMTYVGTPVIWQFDEVAPGTGLVAPGSAAQFGDRIFYLSEDGFDMIENGADVTHIGANRVDRTFYNEFDQNFDYRVSATIDPNNHRVFWAYPTTNASAGMPDKILCYDWSVDKWSISEQESELLLFNAFPGRDMDDPTTGMDAVNVNLDLIGPSLDSRLWMGGAENLGMFNTDHEMAFWIGTPRDATIETSEFSAAENQRALMKAARPDIDGGTTTVQIGYRNLQENPVAWDPASTVNSNGRATMRNVSRFQRLRCNITGEFTDAIGIEPEVRPAGRR